MVYRYRTGHGIKGVDAQVVGERIEALRAANDGVVEPDHVIDDARPEDSELHTAFEWDDSIAAHEHRRNQARSIIRSVSVTLRDDRTGKQIESIAFVSIASPFKEGMAYTSGEAALADPDLRERLLANERAQIEGWARRNENIIELARFVDAIKAAQAEEQRAAAAQRRPRRAARPQPVA